MSAAGKGSLFHGGAPGLAPGAVLRPASELGLHFDFDEGATYLRDRGYVTRELNSARRFASNYLDRFGSRRPGDVYRVEAKGGLKPDRDYPTFGRSEGIFLMTRSAVVLEVVERGSILTRTRSGGPTGGTRTGGEPMTRSTTTGT